MSKRLDKRAKRDSSYLKLYEEYLESPAWLDLSSLARSLFIELQRIYRPSRNGKISLDVRRAATLLGVNKSTVGPAFKELESHGFIALGKGHLWRERKAREWRLTTEPCGNAEPTDDWRSWQPDHEKLKSGFSVPSCPENQDSNDRKQAKHRVSAALEDARRP